MTRRLLRYIRRQPREVRDNYAFAGAMVIALGAGLVWIGQLPDRISMITTPEQSGVTVPETASEESSKNPLPFSNFFSRMRASVADFDPWADWDEFAEEQSMDNDDTWQAEHEQPVFTDNTQDSTQDSTYDHGENYDGEPISGPTSTSTSTESFRSTTTNAAEGQADIIETP